MRVNGGTRLHRDGRQLLELAAGDTGLRPADLPPEQQERLRHPSPTLLGRVTLAGEIIDPKCHFGAMKPGDGRTHKGCAALCLRGGVPPMFVSRDAAGPPAYHLIVGPNGGPLSPVWFDRVGEPVVLDGDEERWGDLRVLMVHGCR